MLTLTQFSRLFKRSNKVSLISDSIPLVLLKRPYKSNSMATRYNFSICPIAVFSHLGWWIKQWLDWLIEFPLLWLGMLIIHAHHRPQLRSLKKNRYDKMPRHTTLQTNQTQLCFFAYSYRLNEPCEFANILQAGKLCACKVIDSCHRLVQWVPVLEWCWIPLIGLGIMHGGDICLNTDVVRFC